MPPDKRLLQYLYPCPNGSDLSLIEPLEPATNKQEIQRTEAHLELHYAVNKIKIAGDSPGQTA